MIFHEYLHLARIDFISGQVHLTTNGWFVSNKVSSRYSNIIRLQGWIFVYRFEGNEGINWHCSKSVLSKNGSDEVNTVRPNSLQEKPNYKKALYGGRNIICFNILINLFIRSLLSMFALPSYSSVFLSEMFCWMTAVIVYSFYVIWYKTLKEHFPPYFAATRTG